MEWRCGNGEFDVEAVEAARKEFRKAAQKGWSVYADNGAVEILDEEASQKILRGKEEQQGKVLVPRFVFTDKNTGPRTKANPLPLLANARVVVPGTVTWRPSSCGAMHPRVAEHRNTCCCPWQPVTMWLDGVLCHVKSRAHS